MLTQAVSAIAVEIGALVVPVGPAWEAALGEDPSLALYPGDGSHPTAAGSYLAACTFLVRLFDERLRGFTVSDRLKIGCEHAERLQAVASRAGACT